MTERNSLAMRRGSFSWAYLLLQCGLNYLLLGIVCFSFSSYLCSRNFMMIIYTLLAAKNEENWHDAIPVFRHKCTWLCAEQQW